jgi:hypothetical protein
MMFSSTFLSSTSSTLEYHFFRPPDTTWDILWMMGPGRLEREAMHELLAGLWGWGSVAGQSCVGATIQKIAYGLNKSTNRLKAIKPGCGLCHVL